jgi:hypothetical protein
MEKRVWKEKVRKNWYWIVIAAIIILLIVGVSAFGSKFFEKVFKNKPKTPPCTADVTLACEDGSTIITQKCIDGVLSNTGKICPCIRDINTTCEDNSIVTTHRCINGTLISTGKVCPCFSDIITTCYDGSKVTSHNCVNGTYISTGKACPPRPAPEPINLNIQRLQALFQKSNYFTKLPSNAAILLTFFDGNGVMRPEKFFISGGGIISNYDGRGYDLEFTMGDYRIPELEGSSDFCATLTKIKEQQDLRAGLKNILSVGKYAYLKNCVSF